MDRQLPGWVTAAGVVSIGALLAVIAALWVSYDALPDRIPVHYGLSGEADAFGSKSPARVFVPPVIGLITAGLMWFNAWALACHSRFKGKGIGLFGVLAIVISAMFVLICITPLLGTNAIPGTPWSMGALATAVLVIAVSGAAKWRTVESEQEAAREHWRLGLIYYNPADPALLVSRPMGTTANFAHPLAWVYVVAIIALLGFTALLIVG